MRQLVAFSKKEWTEMARTGKLVVLLIVFALFGIMNPAIAKLTPWMYEMLGDSLAEQGIVITEVTVDALTSWTQYYKNISMALIVLVIMFSTVMTNEYQKGTLINMLTKGLSRWKVIAAKSIASIAVWTICYWLCYLITYGYNAYFWDNSIAKHVFFGACCIYVFGIWLISLIMLGSGAFTANFAVLLTTCGTVAVSYILSMIPDVGEYLPSQLMNAGTLMNGASALSDYTKAMTITIILTIVNFMLAGGLFNHKKL